MTKKNKKIENRCCEKNQFKEKWICGSLSMPQGEIPKISTEWSKEDKAGQVKARIFNSFRSDYKVKPGLYAIGEPDNLSDVFVSANYKLSFDILRRELGGVDSWILVLDTKGINVWCAAGKGTFGTEELVSKIRDFSLDEIVDNKKVIVPQLGAPGISSYTVKKETGFKVIYGPTQAKDISDYIKNGYKADSSMRRVPFTLKDRIILTPMEVTIALKKIWLYLVGTIIFFGLMPEGILFDHALYYGGQFILLGFCAIIIGAVLTPILLPYIPFRSFALKGWSLGALLFLIILLSIRSSLLNNSLILITSCILFPSISSYLALNFTGCTTYTSESGVKAEMKLAMPMYLVTLILSGICLILYKFQQWS